MVDTIVGATRQHNSRWRSAMAAPKWPRPPQPPGYEPAGDSFTAVPRLKNPGPRQRRVSAKRVRFTPSRPLRRVSFTNPFTIPQQ